MSTAYANKFIMGPSHLLQVLTEGEDALKDGNWFVIFNDNQTIKSVEPMENGTRIDTTDNIVLLSLHVATPITPTEFDKSYNNFLEIHQYIQDNGGHVLDSLVVLEDNKFLSFMCEDSECCPAGGKPYRGEEIPQDIDTALDRLVEILNGNTVVTMSLDELE